MFLRTFTSILGPVSSACYYKIMRPQHLFILVRVPVLFIFGSVPVALLVHGPGAQHLLFILTHAPSHFQSIFSPRLALFWGGSAHRTSFILVRAPRTSFILPRTSALRSLTTTSSFDESRPHFVHRVRVLALRPWSARPPHFTHFWVRCPRTPLALLVQCAAENKTTLDNFSFLR
jgi:hypothetical protein